MCATIWELKLALPDGDSYCMRLASCPAMGEPIGAAVLPAGILVRLERSKQRETVNDSGFRLRHGLSGLDLDPMRIRVVARPSVAVTGLMAAHQCNCASVRFGVRDYDVADALFDPRAGGGRTVAQHKKLKLRQTLLDHLTVEGMIILRGRFK